MVYVPESGHDCLIQEQNLALAVLYVPESGLDCLTHDQNLALTVLHVLYNARGRLLIAAPERLARLLRRHRYQQGLPRPDLEPR